MLCLWINVQRGASGDDTSIPVARGHVRGHRPLNHMQIGGVLGVSMRDGPLLVGEVKCELSPVHANQVLDFLRRRAWPERSHEVRTNLTSGANQLAVEPDDV